MICKLSCHKEFNVPGVKKNWITEKGYITQSTVPLNGMLIKLSKQKRQSFKILWTFAREPKTTKTAIKAMNAMNDLSHFSRKHLLK